MSEEKKQRLKEKNQKNIARQKSLNIIIIVIIIVIMNKIIF